MFEYVVSDTILCVLAFAWQTFLLATITYLSRNHPRCRNDVFIASFVVLWFFNIFNIIYTGVLGWNLNPATLLEEKLDIITSAGFITGAIMNILSRFVFVTKDGVVFIRIQ